MNVRTKSFQILEGDSIRHQIVEDVVWAKVCEMCAENHLRPIYFLEVVLEAMGEDIAQRLGAEYKYRNGAED